MNKKTISFDLASKSNKKKYIIFMTSSYKFGVPVEQISQVIAYENVFSLPNTPDYVLGVINLRGKIISLVHLAKRLGLSETTDFLPGSQILFVDLGFETVGMLIDKVLTLKEIEQENITDDLDLISSQINMEFLKGAAFDEIDDGSNSIVILLNLDMILTEYEVQEIIENKNDLKAALEKKERIEISEEELLKLDLSGDDFSAFGDN